MRRRVGIAPARSKVDAAARSPDIRCMHIRLGSYNLHKCVGTDRVRDPGRSIAVMNQIGADVLALQEVDLRLGARPAALPARMIEESTDYELLPLAQSDVSTGWHGQALLVRRGAHVHVTRRLDLPGLEPRGAVMAELALPGRSRLRVVGVHLALLRPWRRRQLARIRDDLADLPRMPTVILGDFNEWSPDRGLEALDAFDLVVPGRSFHARRPVAALDRLALGGGARLRDAGVLQTPLSRHASDHLPIWADVAID
jgi:endonuclease/exonuclease/phosphatase family metal-dependent hydrolase